MSNQVKVQVTAHHIKRGNPVSPTECPVALAVHEVIGGALVSVVDASPDGRSAGTISVSPDKAYVNEVKYQMPKKVDLFIKRFDEGKSVKPFSFVLREAP